MIISRARVFYTELTHLALTDFRNYKKLSLNVAEQHVVLIEGFWSNKLDGSSFLT